MIRDMWLWWGLLSPERHHMAVYYAGVLVITLGPIGKEKYAAP